MFHMGVIVGTSGWQYPHWRETFYPKGLPQARWLEYFAERFATVEVNNTFYRLPDAEVFESWRKRTPGDFVVTVKMSRYLTHIKRLKDPEEPVSRFMERAVRLGPKLGPILIQLPPNLEADPSLLDAALKRFPKRVRLAVEFRHNSWFTDEIRQILVSRRAALCLADSPRRKIPVWQTAPWTFLRFHEGRSKPHPCYGRKALRSWAARLADGWGPEADIYVYFNNDPRACALRDAQVFADETARLGLETTRVPPKDDVTLGR